MAKVILAATLAAVALSQGLNNCYYRIGGIELDLRSFDGFSFHYQGNDGVYIYAPCTNDLVCPRDGTERAAMVNYWPDGVNECLDVANYDQQIQPFYEFYVSSWIFNYSSIELCTATNIDQTNRSAQISWNCNEDASFPYISDVFHYNECNDLVQIEWVGACPQAPPPNTECVFHDAGHTLNLSTIQSTNLQYTDSNNHTVAYSVCANNFICVNEYGTKPNMCEVLDHSGSCGKYFGIWSGDSNVFYDHNIFGQNYYEFFWMNGQECGDGGPAEVLNIRYYCANVTETTIVSFEQAGPPCQFRMEIDTPLACESNEKGELIFPKVPRA